MFAEWTNCLKRLLFFQKRVKYNMVDDEAYIHWVSYFIVPFPFSMTVGLLIGFRTKLTLDELNPPLILHDF